MSKEFTFDTDFIESPCIILSKEEDRGVRAKYMFLLTIHS